MSLNAVFGFLQVDTLQGFPVSLVYSDYTLEPFCWLEIVILEGTKS